MANEGGVVRLSGSSGEVVSSGTIDAAGDGSSTGGRVSLEGEKVGIAGGAVVNADGGAGGGTVLIGGGVQTALKAASEFLKSQGKLAAVLKSYADSATPKYAQMALDGKC